MNAVRGFPVACLTAFLLALSGHEASPQVTGTIKIVVPYPAGGGADILARLLGEQVGRSHGSTVVIENRPGAGTSIGTEAASRAAPDGNTVLMNAPEFVINPHLKNLNYDPLTSFEPVCYLVRLPAVMVVNSESPYRTLAEFVSAARAKPGELTLASTGPGTVFHIAFERFKRVADVDITFVPFAGNAPATNALLGGHVAAGFAVYPVVAQQIKAGKLRALATGGQARLETLPDVSTFIEAGYQDYEVDVWLGLVAPAKTPTGALTHLAGLFTAALQAPEVKSKLAAQGFYPAVTCGANFGALLRQQYETYGRVIRDAKIKAP